jgi:hypothetical protein
MITILSVSTKIKWKPKTNLTNKYFHFKTSNVKLQYQQLIRQKIKPDTQFFKIKYKQCGYKTTENTVW